MKNPILYTLIDTIESVHALTVWYSSLLKDIDPAKLIACNGTKLNSLYWLTAHIANSEDYLLLKALDQKGHQLKWLSEYSLGSEQELEKSVTYKELATIAKDVHQESIAFLKTLSDEDLQKKNIFNFKFDGDNSYKAVILHHIRHEGIHAGH